HKGGYQEKLTSKGTRRKNRIFTKRNRERCESLLLTLREISERYDIIIAQVALKWVTRTPTVTTIPGAKSINQVQTNVKSSDLKLTKDEVGQIEKAIKEFKPRFFL
ncbi:MAG: aldo/keto reductase, partial [Candidatus Hodarchaeota archaeon]